MENKYDILFDYCPNNSDEKTLKLNKFLSAAIRCSFTPSFSVPIFILWTPYRGLEDTHLIQLEPMKSSWWCEGVPVSHVMPCL